MTINVVTLLPILPLLFHRSSVEAPNTKQQVNKHLKDYVLCILDLISESKCADIRNGSSETWMWIMTKIVFLLYFERQSNIHLWWLAFHCCSFKFRESKLRSATVFIQTKLFVLCFAVLLNLWFKMHVYLSVSDTVVGFCGRSVGSLLSACVHIESFVVKCTLTEGLASRLWQWSGNFRKSCKNNQLGVRGPEFSEEESVLVSFFSIYLHV